MDEDHVINWVNMRAGKPRPYERFLVLCLPMLFVLTSQTVLTIIGFTGVGR